MALYLSPIGNGAQFFTSGGLPLNGGFLNTYAAGTSTPLATYTTPAGNIANSVNIQLNSDGRPPNEIWFTQGQSYKFTLTDSLLNLIATYDNLAGINDPTANITSSEWIATGFIPSYISATQFSVPNNQLLSFAIGRRVQVTVSAGTLYGTVTASSFAASITTVTLRMDSGTLDSGLSVVNIGIINSLNTSFPILTDAEFRVSGSTDQTKLLAFELDTNLATGVTRTWTAQDKNITPAGLQDTGSALWGCTMSTAGSSTTMSIASGVAVDTTKTIGMALSAISKTTSIWAVGTGNGGLDAGSMANNTWFHFYVIRRPDTGVVDVTFSTNATTPVLPANYTQYRRIGSGLTNGSGQWTKFTQDGDVFTWDVIVQDINTTNPGTSAVSRTLTVPLGVVTYPIIVANVNAVTSATIYCLLTALNQTATVPAVTGFSLLGSTSAPNGLISFRDIATNTSSQIRSQQSASGASDTFRINTIGWIDYRGRNT